MTPRPRRRTPPRPKLAGTSSVEFTVLLVCICIAGLATWGWFGPIIHRIILGDD